MFCKKKITISSICLNNSRCNFDPLETGRVVGKICLLTQVRKLFKSMFHIFSFQHRYSHTLKYHLRKGTSISDYFTENVQNGACSTEDRRKEEERQEGKKAQQSVFQHSVISFQQQEERNTGINSLIYRTECT